MTPARLEELKQAVVAYAVALADGQGRWADDQAVAAQLGYGKPDAGNLFHAFAEAPRALPGS